MSVKSNGKQTHRSRASFYDLPPEIRQLVYIQVITPLRYPSQCYYHLLHSHQTPIWEGVGQFEQFRRNYYNSDINHVWEYMNSNHGFAYSLHVQRRFFSRQISLLQTSKLIRAEVLYLVYKSLVPPLAVWRDLAVETSTQCANFLQRVSKCLLNASVRMHTITALHLHSDLILKNAGVLTSWVLEKLPALRTLVIVVDVLMWDPRHYPTSNRKEHAFATAFWHQSEGPLCPWRFIETMKSFAPLANIGTRVAEVRFAIVVPKAGYCACTWESRVQQTRPTRAATMSHANTNSTSAIISGAEYRDLLWLQLQKVVMVVEMMWYGAVKGAKRQCSWDDIFVWVDARFDDNRFDPYADLLTWPRVFHEAHQVWKLDAVWLQRMTGRRMMVADAYNLTLDMASESGQEFGWAGTSYVIEQRCRASL